MRGIFGTFAQPRHPGPAGLSLLTGGALPEGTPLLREIDIVATADHENLSAAVAAARHAHVALWRGAGLPPAELQRSLLAAAARSPVEVTGHGGSAPVRILAKADAQTYLPDDGPGADLLLWRAVQRRWRVRHGVSPLAWGRAPRRPAVDPAGWLDVVQKLAGADALQDEALAVLAHFIGGDAARYAAVIDGLKLRGLAADVLSRLNGRAARHLVFAFCFLPHVDPSAIVMAKRLDRLPLPSDVISNRLKRGVPADASLLGALGGKLGHRLQLAAPPKLESWPAIRRFADDAFSAALRLERDKGPYETLSSRAQWSASHFAAARYKLHRPEVQWTAEFSDPLLKTTRAVVRTMRLDRRWLLEAGVAQAFAAQGLAMPEDDRIFFWAEALPILLAERLIFTNANQLDCMAHYQPVEALRRMMLAKAVISPHPAPPADLYMRRHPAYALDAARINIAYFGSFYKVRGLGEVVAALAALPPAERERFVLHVFTGQQRGVRALAGYRAARPAIRINAYVGYLDFLALTRRFDYLLVNDARSAHEGCANPYRPSKLSDYQGSLRPIWAVCEPGSPLSQEELPRGSLRSAEGDGTSIAAGLREMLRLRTISG